MSANWESKSLCSPYVEKFCWSWTIYKSNATLVLPLAVCCVEIVSVLQHAGSWPLVPRENQVPQETYLHAPPLGPGILQNMKKQNALCTTWYVHVIPASWLGLISNVYFTVLYCIVLEHWNSYQFVVEVVPSLEQEVGAGEVRGTLQTAETWTWWRCGLQIKPNLSGIVVCKSI